MANPILVLIEGKIGRLTRFIGREAVNVIQLPPGDTAPLTASEVEEFRLHPPIKDNPCLTTT